MKQEVKDVIEQCGVGTIEEVTALLEQTAARGHKKIACLLNEKTWTEWNPFVISQIPNAIKWKPQVYSDIWTKDGKRITIVGEEFISPETFEHKDFDREIYKLVEISSNERQKSFRMERIVPVDKEQEVLEKIKNKINFSEDELAELAYGEIGVIDDEICSGEGRWQKQMQTILKIKDEFVAINWGKGLTEQQEDSFWDQPYLVDKFVELVTIEKVTWALKNNDEK